MNGYDKLARYYDTDKSPVWQEVKDLLRDIKPDVAVLDIGCGTGRVRQVLPDNIDYTGLDNSPELLDVARRRHSREKFIQADARALPFGDNSFDAVLLIATIHHFLDKAERLKVLNEAWRVLKSDGQIYCTVWNLNRPKFWRHWRGWRRVVVPNRHDREIKRTYYAYNRQILERELTQAGFIVERLDAVRQNIVGRAKK